MEEQRRRHGDWGVEPGREGSRVSTVASFVSLGLHTLLLAGVLSLGAPNADAPEAVQVELVGLAGGGEPRGETLGHHPEVGVPSAMLAQTSDMVSRLVSVPRSLSEGAALSRRVEDPSGVIETTEPVMAARLSESVAEAKREEGTDGRGTWGIASDEPASAAGGFADGFVPSIGSTSGQGRSGGAGFRDGSGTGGVDSDLTRTILARIERAKRYPPAARREGIEGTVELRFTIVSSGRVGRVEVVSSSGSSLLDRAAIETLRRAEPLPVAPGWIRLPIAYRLTP